MNGLTSHQAVQLLKEYGYNMISEQKKKHFLVKIFEQFNNFLTILLIFAAVFSFIIGESIDGILILSVVILNGLFGVYQEAKAEESLAAIKKMTISKVRVIRSGVEQEIDSKEIVPGDIVFIEEGVKIPADGKVIQSRSLELNESALTGESLPVIKNLEEEVFMGTIVAKGRGYIEITKTGMSTKFGQIAKELSQIEDTKTPLQKKIEALTRLIGVVGIITAFIVFLLSIIEGSLYFPAFLLAISLAVAIVPEGLPAVMTITLAIGVKEMARRKSIVRKLSAIEALGSITLIATDKTGTLTTNKMKVKEIYVEEKKYSDHFPPLANRTFSLLVLNGILCSTASLVHVHGSSWDVLGDPTEGALLFLGQKIGLIPEMIRKKWELIEEMPFDSVTKRMSVKVRNSESIISNSELIFSKGAPESILSLCSSRLIGNIEKTLDAKQKEKVLKQVEEWGSKGLRILAFSYNKISNNKAPNSKQIQNSNNQNPKQFGTWNLELGTSQIFLGMVAIHDAPRPEAVEAVAKAQKAGIRVVMITGDNEKTAEAIAAYVGIIKYGEKIITGSQLDNFSDKELLKILPDVKVFARTTPFHKHKIVRLFQQLGEIVAVTGDGVNDAIALKQADVGVAMGLVGTDVARETADMVITDDNFSSIVNAVEEGRNIIKNLKNSITYLLSCNITEAVSLILALILGFPNIFYPLQFLYINLITDGLPALALAFSPRNSQLMNHPPDKQLSLISSFGKKYILMISVVSSILVLGAFYYYLVTVNMQVAKTAAFSILVLVQSFIFVDLWLSHQPFRSNLKKLMSPLFLSAFLFPFIGQFVIVNFEKTASIFKVVQVSPIMYGQFMLISALMVIAIKGAKKLIWK